MYKKVLLSVTLAVMFAVTGCGTLSFEGEVVAPGEPTAESTRLGTEDLMEPTTEEPQPMTDEKPQPVEQPESAGIPVVGWLGYVVSTSEGAQFDDYLVLVPEGTGEFGLEGMDESIEAQIVALRDQEEPGKYANFWGTLTCDVIDYGGCQLLVTRIRSGIEITEPEPIEGWEGKIYSNEPGAQFSHYFVLDGDYPVRYGIASYIAENGWPIYKEELENQRDSGQTIRVSGDLVCGVPDVNGCQIQVKRLEVNGVQIDPYEGWETFTNEEYGFSFRYPSDWTLEENPGGGDGTVMGKSVLLSKDTLTLFIGFKRITEDVFIGWTGLPAGDIDPRAMVPFMGTELESSLLIYEGKVKVILYGDAEVGDLMFAIRLDDFNADYDAVDISPEWQIRVDEILGTFKLIE